MLRCLKEESMELKLLDAGSIYKGFEYPKEFLKIVHLGLTDFDFWYLMDYEQAAWRIKGLQERYPDRKLVPFARRGDNDDIVCFDIDRGGREQRKDYESFWDWFREAIDEMIEEGEYDEI